MAPLRSQSNWAKVNFIGPTGVSLLASAGTKHPSTAERGGWRSFANAARRSVLLLYVTLCCLNQVVPKSAVGGPNRQDIKLISQGEGAAAHHMQLGLTSAGPMPSSPKEDRM
jgi:hypothetical protein